MKLYHLLMITLSFMLGILVTVAFPTLIPHVHDMEHTEHSSSVHGWHGHDMEHYPEETDPDLPIPTIALDIEKDAMAWYNAYITTQNFTFIPEKASRTKAINNEWHGHIYVNDIKAGRVYGNAFHLPDSYFTPWENIVRFTLNAHTHGDWTRDGEIIEDEVVVVVK